MSITVGNPLLSNHVIVMFIDSDKNPGTGLPGLGADYEMFAFPTAGGRLLAWNGSTFVASSAASFKLSSAGNVQQFGINRADLGNTAGFAFGIVSASVDGSDLHVWDVMPSPTSLSTTCRSHSARTARTTTAMGRSTLRILAALTDRCVVLTYQTASATRPFAFRTAVM
jgi:hypothetical protein